MPVCTVRSENACLCSAWLFRVRHEAAEALGAIASDSTVGLLEQFAKDAEPIVAHSCVVALDVLEHEKSGAAYFAGTEQQQ